MANFCANCGSRLEENGKCLKCDNNNSKNKSRITAGLLGIFLGGFGAHNFYLGNKGRGISQILVTFSTCFTGFLWGLIEGILILCGVINEDYFGNKLN